MARARRFLPTATPAHLVQRAVDRRTLFRDRSDFQQFIDVLTEAGFRYPVSLFGYCVMPNHWHLLAQSSEPGGISRYMRWLTSTHAVRYRISRETVGHGHLYQGRFWSEPIAGEEHFFNVLRYVEANAARAGLVSIAEDWPWSSAHDRTLGEAGILARPPVDLPRNWNQLLNTNLDCSTS